MAVTPAGSAGGALPSLGTARQIKAILETYNTSPDGGPRKSLGTEVLYGPGMMMDIPTSAESITQIMATVSDEEIAWPVLSRICRDQKWKLVDLESGRSFG